MYMLPLVLFGVFFLFIFRQAKSGAAEAFTFTKARARLFGAEGHPKTRINFNDVAGLKEAKEELKEIVDFLKNPQKYLKMGAKIPRGVLLLGPAGVGKTLLARAVAGEASVPFFSISGSEFVEMFVGVGSARVRDLFSIAKKASPSIIFIDELDAIGRHRGAGIGGGHDEREQTLNQILVEMDGFERETNVIIMAATNRGDILDPALLRPGRFDRKVVLDPPDIHDREEIMKIHCKGKPLALDVNLREIAERTPGFSGADLANVVNEAAILAARKNKTQVYQGEFLESIEKVLLGPERRSHILSKKEKEIAAYHEVGHALVSSFLPNTEPVRKISIIARGMAAGYTLQMPSEERKMRTKKQFLAEIATLLGGYCAEKIRFGEITTGAANDLSRASDLARKLVKEYGMSPLGPVSFGEKEELVFLGKEISEQRNYSEKIAARIDEEVSRFIRDAEKEALATLSKRRKLLDKVAGTLIEKETIEREEFEMLINLKLIHQTASLAKAKKIVKPSLKVHPVK
jgi:cell division protease FtsH